jgi:hypothetical protein
MLVLPGVVGKDTCVGIARRELMRVGGSDMFDLTLADLPWTLRRRPQS